MGKAFNVENDEVLFTLNFLAKMDTNLSEAINLDDKYTKAEAYNSKNEVSDLQLLFNNVEQEISTVDDFELFQNNPNPFSEKTRIGFTLPEAQYATLKIYDVTGKVNFEYSDTFARGFNEISLNGEVLKTEGTMYYQLSSEKYNATRKMILLR